MAAFEETEKDGLGRRRTQSGSQGGFFDNAWDSMFKGSSAPRTQREIQQRKTRLANLPPNPVREAPGYLPAVPLPADSAGGFEMTTPTGEEIGVTDVAEVIEDEATFTHPQLTDIAEQDTSFRPSNYINVDLPQATMPNKMVNRASVFQDIAAQVTGRTLQRTWYATSTPDPNMTNVAYSEKIFVGKSKDRESSRAAQLVMRDISDRLHRDTYMTKAYKKLGGYLISVSVLLLAVVAQWGVGGSEQPITAVMQDMLFSIATDTLDYQGNIQQSLSSTDDIYDWLEAVLDDIFTEPVCGDGECDAPDEYPYFQAATDARQFTGCETDCGTASTTRVMVDFFDPWKLQYAYDAIEEAWDNGYDYGAGIYSAKRYGAESLYPYAGWNVCSRSDSEYGFFTNVCMFDGDIFIDGLPYRQSELENNSDDFGGSLTMSLYEGPWEVRVAFSNFEWTSPVSGDGDIPIAFPAVRGQVCTWNTGSRVCSTWNPCEAAYNCSCQWWRDGYYECWEEREFDNWQNVWGKYVENENLRYLAQYALNDTTYDNPYESKLNRSELNDDQWVYWEPCPAGDFFRIIAAAPDGVWNTGQTLTLKVDTSGAGSSSDASTINTWTLTGGSNSDDDEVQVVIDKVWMCPQYTYFLTVNQGTGGESIVFYVADDASGDGGLLDVGTLIEEGILYQSFIVVGIKSTSNCGFFGGSGTGYAYAQFGDAQTEVVCSQASNSDFYYYYYYDDYWDDDYWDDDWRRRLTSEEEDEAGGEADTPARAPAVEDPSKAPKAPSFQPASRPVVVGGGRQLSNDNTSAPTITPAPTVTFMPTSLPTPGPTPSPTNSWGTKPTIWTNWTMWYVQAEEVLPFSASTTSCSSDTWGDGTCDSTNNNMACGFDGGDCCKSTCSGDDDGACDSSSFNCKSPDRLYADEWPYFDFNSQTKFPYTTQKAFADVLYAKNGDVEMTELPSLTCPDCDAYTGSYLSIPFYVSADYQKHQMFPGLNDTRQREYPTGNRIIGGVLLTQKRGKSGKCSGLPDTVQDNFLNDCTKGSTTEPYAVDQTFVSTSSLYRATNNWTDYYETSEVDTSDLPYGFFYDQGCVTTNDDGIESTCASGTVRNYPILFDVNFNVTRKSTFFTLIDDANYIDDDTKELSVTIPLVNYKEAKLIRCQVIFTPNPAGGWNFENEVSVLEANPGDRGWLQYVILALWAVVLLWLAAIEAIEIMSTWWSRGHPFDYIFDIGNMLDLASICLQAFAMYVNEAYVRLGRDLTFDLHYDVYKDFMAVARLPQVSETMGTYQDMISELDELVKMRFMYSSIVAICLLCACLQFIKNLDFHPQCGLITRTLNGAAADLGFFMFLFLSVVLIFAFLGLVLFGQYSEDFYTLSVSFLSILNMVTGVFDPTDDISLSTQPEISMVFYWSFQVITFFILLNALLAIIVEAYDATKKAAAEQAKLDPLYRYIVAQRRSGFFIYVPNPLQRCEIKNSDIVRLLEDLLCLNEAKQLRAGAQMEALVDGQWSTVLLIEAYPDGVWSVLDLTTKDTKFVGEHEIRVESNRYVDVRLPTAVWETIKDVDFDDMTTDSRFYLINKGDVEDIQYRLLDQTSLIVAMQCIAPFINLKVCYALTMNLLVRFGVDADINNDGVISTDEWDALCLLMENQTTLRGKNGYIGTSEQRDRLASMML